MIPSNELRIALSLARSASGGDYPGICWEFHPGGPLKLIGANGPRLTIVTLAVEHCCTEHTRFRMSPEDAEAVQMMVALADSEATVMPCGPEQMVVMVDDRMHTAVARGEYPKGAGVLDLRDCPVSEYSWAEIVKALQDCGWVTDERVRVRIDTLTYRGLYIEPVLREDLTAIVKVQMAVTGRRCSV